MMSHGMFNKNYDMNKKTIMPVYSRIKFLVGEVVVTRTHRWELPGNYRDTTRVIVFYLFFWRSMRILVTVFCHLLCIYIFINDIYIAEPSGNIFEITMPHLYKYRDINKVYRMVIYFHGSIFPLIFVSYC